MGLSNNLSCEVGSFSRCRLNPHRSFQSVVSGFLSPSWNSGLRSLSSGPPAAASPTSCSMACPTLQSATLLIHQPLPCCTSSLPRLPVSTPPTSLDECVFFVSLVVGLPYSLIFCQFWLFFVFKLLSFFWLCEEAQCIYLHLHLGWKSCLLAQSF